MVILAQVSDFHFDGGWRSAARAERVMGYLATLPRPVDAVLVTGDVADHGAAAEYLVAREVLRRHPQVAGVLCGHAHTAASTQFAGRPLVVAPGVASTVMLPAERPDGPPLDLDLPAAITFHVLDGGRLTSHVRVVG